MKNLPARIALLGGLIGAASVLIQFYINMTNPEEAPGLAFFRFFGFFTMIGNILVAVHLLTLGIPSLKVRWPRYASAAVSTSMATYITIVGVVYYALLHGSWDPDLLQQIVSLGLHAVMPIFMVLYWFVFVDKSEVSFNIIPRMMLTPIVYLVYAFILGAITGKYPYGFLDVGQHGLFSVLITSAILMGCGVVVASIYIGLGKLLPGKK